jgi:hypothetical protein
MDVQDLNCEAVTIYQISRRVLRVPFPDNSMVQSGYGNDLVQDKDVQLNQRCGFI